MSIPNSLYGKTERERMRREAERIAWMQERHPGVSFSNFSHNPLGVRAAKAMGMPGAGLPYAIYPRAKDLKPEFDESEWAQILTAYRQWKDRVTGYVSFTCLQTATRLPYSAIFANIAAYHKANPYLVKFSVDRGGNCTFVGIKETP